MRWLEETHGRQFELVRHFLRRMFEGEWSSSPGQWKSAAIGILSLFLPAGLLLVREGAMDPRYASKYRLLSLAAGPDAIRAASIADELALVTLLICVTGLIALLEWQSLFPSGRDHLALASLPVRPGQIFTARFTAVFLFSTILIGAMNLLPSLIAPAEFGGGWRLDSSFPAQAGAQAVSSGLACFFVFFAVLALQGALLNALPAALFARAAVYVQGALAGIFILGGLFSWSIKEWPARTIAELPRFGASLPPVWFTGLHQRLTGDPDPFFAAMAGRSWLAAGIVLALAILGYLVSYRRYRRLLLESPVRLAIPIAWRWSPLRWLARSPRREAIMDFMAKTLARSRTHRLLWLVYLGAAAAVLLNSSLIDGAILMRSHGWSKALRFLVLFWPLACSVVVLNGFRHVLSIPAELPANWIFQITEAHGRAEWMSAVERFVMAYAVAPIYLVLFPVAGYVLGWPMAVRMTVLQLLITLSIFETLFYSWQKLPFTCSHIPGERPLVGVVGKYVALLCALVPIVSLMIAIASQIWFLYPVYLASFGGIWIGLRRRRREGWGEAKLIYEDAPAVVTDLGLKELTYAGTEAQLRRTVAGDAGYADSEESHSRPDARVRGHGIYPADLRGRPESGGGSALPGAAPPGTARPAGIGMGRLGEQPAGQILQPDAGGARISGGGGGPLAEDGGRHRPHHGTGLRVPPVVGFCHRLFFAFHRRQLDRDLEDELAFHLAMREAKYRSDGADDARTAARRQFGNLASVKETCRDLWTLGWIEALWQDLRYGVRQVSAHRGFAIVTAATLSLGVAATTTIYSVCEALVWKTPALRDPDSLVTLLERFPGNPHLWNPSSAADVDDLRHGDALLEGLASWENATAKIVDSGGEALRVDQARVSPNFFDVLGVAPALGRGFQPGDDRPDRERQVVLSDRLWRNRFGANPGLPGKIIRLDGADYAVIGIMPPKFAFPRAGKEVWTPLALTPRERESRGAPRLDSVGRLKPGRTLRQVQAELDALALRLEKLYPQTNAKRGFMAWPVRRYLVGDYASQFGRMLLGAALFVLLIVCMNVANLQLARGAARRREAALRQALGAGRWRIVAQLVIETVVLALAGCALGIGMAWCGARAIRTGMPAELQRYSSGWADLGINPRVLAFALAAAVLSGILAGFVPALRASRTNLTESLKEGGLRFSVGPGRRRLRSTLLAAEIALSLVLLVGAGLMVRGFRAILGGETAVEPAGLLTLRVESELHRDLLERIAMLPGVQAVAAVSALPYGRHARFSEFGLLGANSQPGRPPVAQIQAVSPDYFRAMRIPLRTGRLLGDRDRLSAVLSEEAARGWWPSGPIGQQIRLGARWLTIVGVVGGVKASVMDRAPRPTVYVPYAEFPEPGMDIAIRCAGDPLALAAPVRSAVKAVDPEQPVADLMTLERMRRNEAIGLTYAAALMSVFGFIALALSCIGVYGMTAYLVSERTHEIGVRMALGAAGPSVLGMIFRQGARAVLAGIALGLLLALALARVLAAIIWGVRATDPGAFTAIPLLLISAAALAIYLPARRAVRIDPLTALRHE